MEAFKVKPIPKSYPGIFIQTSVKELSFNYDDFMKSFHTEEIVKVPKKKEFVVIDKFTVEKLDYITIPEFLIKQLATCVKMEPPISDQSYTIENRMVFMNQIQSLLKAFVPKKDISCDSMNEELTLLPHQKLVQTYMNMDTPYRGVLLYHGLGSGKTCSSIAITENLKAFKNIVVMSPASLETNYVQELKKCGSPLYKSHQHWTWTTTPTIEQLNDRCLTDKDYLRRNKSRGIWINENKASNYDALSSEDQLSVQEQIDKMIRKQYQFIHYNGLTVSKFKELSASGNPFSNKVVVIDEAHNFVSRIVNQLKDASHTSMQLYDLLMKAEKCKIILLTGTPVINYSHEVSILFNLLKGYIVTYSCQSKVKDELREALPDTDMIYSIGETTFFTQLPYGFTLHENKAIYTAYDSTLYQDRLEKFIGKKVTVTQQTLLPDSKKEFENQYIHESKLVNQNKLMFRISGLSSYFPDLTQLMPKLRDTILHNIPMSDVQLGEYSMVRAEERKREKVKKPKDDDIPGTYRIHSRLICNTTYPKKVREARPGKEEEEVDVEEPTRDLEQFFKAVDDSDYTANIDIYSPKYAKMIEIIQYTKGLHLVYSQFLTIEGIALFSRVLDSKGYTEFRLTKNKEWELNVKDVSKPMYVTYIGTKTQEEKELIRSIFNKDWKNVPEKLRQQVEKINIQIFMITSAGAEGISLKEVQYVHIMEPYWNPVRIDQVIGRARRICSHKDLPEREQFVEVHLYVMTFPPTLTEGLKLDLVEGTPGSTDEFLFSISKRKRELNMSIMECIKKSSIDCFLYDKDYLRIAETDPTIYSYFPDHTKDITGDKDITTNIQKEKVGHLQHKGENVVKFYVKRKEGDLTLLYSMKSEDVIGYINLSTKKIFDKDKKPTTLDKLKHL